MPHHVIVDGSNLATEGRAMPSLAQLNEAVMAFIDEHPSVLITVVVDATFGHRIDAKEVAEFDDAVANNELVAPPAGAIGRGDAFLLGIANKVSATVLSNDSFQEFHGTYTWLFDEGRLIGGKPVPHIGWVFVARAPVRGAVSRGAVKDARRKKDGTVKAVKRQASPEASKPMPVPKAPPPNATVGRATTRATAATPTAAPAPAARSTDAAGPARANGVNELMPFLTFVEHHPPGTSVNAIVETYSSHGAYVRLGDVSGYLPLRLMADPAPRSARELVKVGDAITLVVESFAPLRRSIELAMVGMATVAPPSARAPAKRGRKAAPAPAAGMPATPAATPPGAPPAKAPAKTPRRAGKRAAAAPVETVPASAPAPMPRRLKPAARGPAAPKPAPAPTPPAEQPAAKKAPATKSVAKKAAAAKAPTKKAVPATAAVDKTAPRKAPQRKAAATKAVQG